VFIIDITGTPFVDAEVADYLMRTARAARLLGVECMLVGISPRVAQVLVQLGMDLSEVGKTYSTLESGLLDALRRMRYRVEKG
jgi:rsbT co-antagonist protein RsbR